MKEFIRLGTQFVGYRDHAKKLEGTFLSASFAKHTPLFCHNFLLSLIMQKILRNPTNVLTLLLSS
jgi:hypothetical protein